MPLSPMITALLARLTPPCKDITRLASESMDRKLPLLMRVKIQLHLLICEGCRRYAEQLQTVRNKLRSLARGMEGESGSSGSARSQEARARLKDAFNRRRD